MGTYERPTYAFDFSVHFLFFFIGIIMYRFVEIRIISIRIDFGDIVLSYLRDVTVLIRFVVLFLNLENCIESSADFAGIVCIEAQGRIKIALMVKVTVENRKDLRINVITKKTSMDIPDWDKKLLG
jgi:hypothetical protein